MRTDLTKLFRRSTELKTPFLLQIGLALNALFVAGPMGKALTDLRDLEVNLMPLASGLTQLLLLIGIHNLKRWAILGLFAIAVFGVAGALLLLPPGGELGIIFAIAIRAALIVPAIFYWRLMTWT